MSFIFGMCSNNSEPVTTTTQPQVETYTAPDGTTWSKGKIGEIDRVTIENGADTIDVLTAPGGKSCYVTSKNGVVTNMNCN
ncbi:hypothetical protein Glo7428_4106 [Gloeocapsa sp. PCC 7428]|uniref:hypothetical protein n=1 Tax=Gloeocapsa sp. PCC 7428 TaxID=1173026 RepID=UPI0002A5FD75|nr:hypothetical protein [Gloeocapsa sp. PCC 7428]AFZ32555.1 hypothetical protein Glo7428_4106 [Gloeocapsa sp. PCC 7428]